MKRQYWESFINDMSGTRYAKKTVIVPLLATENFTQLTKILGACIDSYNRLLDKYGVDSTYYQMNRMKAKDMLLKEHSNHEWADFWKNIMVPEGMDGLGSLNELCKAKGNRVLFLVDGLEELFTDTLRNENERIAVSSLCKDVIGELHTKYENIACLVFTRRDIIKNAVPTNFEQFASQYKGLELLWSKTEALRLALWLISEAEESFKEGIRSIEDAADDEKKLPFASGDFGLNKDDENILIQEGYLYNDMGKCYLPEIIRHALGFTYSQGARPKVLALMSRRK